MGHAIHEIVREIDRPAAFERPSSPGASVPEMSAGALGPYIVWFYDDDMSDEPDPIARRRFRPFSALFTAMAAAFGLVLVAWNAVAGHQT